MGSPFSYSTSFLFDNHREVLILELVPESNAAVHSSVAKNRELDCNIDAKYYSIQLNPKDED